jgi:drug/metabolite transporter (DMT)-like permease
VLPIIFGIGSALAWGLADFTGGLASKRARAYQVVLVAEIVGILPLLGLAFVWNEPLPGASVWLWSAAASGMGTFGLLILYRALAEGQMSIAAPVSALLAAVFPVIVGALTLGLPDATTLLGFGLGLAAVWTISYQSSGAGWRLDLRSLALPLSSGLFFGSYFVLMHEATRSAFFWPLFNGRVAGTLIMLVYARLRRGAWWPARQALPLSLLSGVVDVLGSICYVLAARLGRMDVAAVLAALYPGSTVVLAAAFLRERLAPIQAFGVALALGAIVLLTIG